MTLLFMDGFESGDYGLGKYSGTPVTAGSALTASTRFGVGLAMSNSTTSTPLRKDFPAMAKVIVGFAAKFAAFDDNNAVISVYGDAGATVHARLRVLANGSVGLYRSGTLVASSAAGVCQLNSWHYLEMSATVSDTVGVITARVDGVQVATFTGDTKNAGTASTIDRVDISPPSNASIGLTVDDVYILDGLGAAPWNDFLGDVRVLTVKPNGAGSQTDLTPVGGANYANVDEFPFSVTDYNFSATPGARDLYAMEDVLAGITVLGVQVNSAAHKTDSTVRSVKNLVKSGATVTASAAKTLAATPAVLSTPFQVNPTTSAQWTAAEVNAMETGVEVL